MTANGIESRLPGSDAVIKWFGEWPSFHDAEIVGLSLARSRESNLRVYPYSPNNPATVVFFFEKITDLELADFSSQNVISSLKIDEVIDQTKEKAIRLTLSPCFGLAGRIDAKSLRVELIPGKSPDDVSSW
jgi:hypothetical protein